VTDIVVIRSRTEATHVGEFVGITPAGRGISWQPVTIVWV